MQLKVEGSFVASPPTVTDATFPGAVFNAKLQLLPSPKQSSVWSGDVKNLNSPSAYVTLSGLGPSDNVTRANTFYIRCTSPIYVRYTTVALPDPIVAEIPVQGLCILEFPDANAATLIEVKGTGFLEYFVSGNQLFG